MQIDLSSIYRQTGLQIRNDDLYPDIDDTLTIKVPNIRLELRRDIMDCVKKLTEKYISEKKISGEDAWKSVAFTAFYIVYKALKVGPEYRRFMTIEDIVSSCFGSCDKADVLRIEKEILEMNNYIICGYIRDTTRAMGEFKIPEKVQDIKKGEIKGDKVSIKNRLQILKELDDVIYPFLSEVLSRKIVEFSQDSKDPQDLKLRDIVLKCMKHLIENYIFKFNPPRKDWVNIGLGALFLVYKSFSLDDNYKVEIGARDLKYECSGIPDYECTTKEINRFEREILKMNDYVICSHLYNLEKSPSKIHFQRITRRALRKKKRS